MPSADTTDAQHRTRAYDKAAGRWSDKMRALGYYDAYLGMLSAPGQMPAGGGRVLDVGTGTGAFAEAWSAVHGRPAQMTLLDPSGAMLKEAQSRLRRRDVASHAIQAGLGETDPGLQYDNVLAAHVIEHFDDTRFALDQMARLLRPGGKLWLVVSKPHWCNAIIWLQWRHRTFSRESVLALLGQSGLAPEADYRFPSGPPSRTSMGFVARKAE